MTLITKSRYWQKVQISLRDVLDTGQSSRPSFTRFSYFSLALAPLSHGVCISCSNFCAHRNSLTTKYQSAPNHMCCDLRDDVRSARYSKHPIFFLTFFLKHFNHGLVNSIALRLMVYFCSCFRALKFPLTYPFLLYRKRFQLFFPFFSFLLKAFWRYFGIVLEARCELYSCNMCEHKFSKVRSFLVSKAKTTAPYRYFYCSPKISLNDVICSLSSTEPFTRASCTAPDPHI